MKQFLLILFFVFIGCSPTQPNITTGEYLLHTNVMITEDWCYMPDETKVNGYTTYNTWVRSLSTICVSLKSDDPHRTLQHELDHAWRNAVGLDARWAGHENHCTAGTC